jgi:hypothetical protein
MWLCKSVFFAKFCHVEIGQGSCSLYSNGLMVYIYIYIYMLVLFKFFNGESYSVKIRWARLKHTGQKENIFETSLSFIYFPLYNQGSCMYTKKSHTIGAFILRNYIWQGMVRKHLKQRKKNKN